MCTQIAGCDILKWGDDMAYTKESYEASKKYKRENIKRVPLDMKIEDYEALRAAADATGEKVNEFIKKAIRERMERNLTAGAHKTEG